MAHCLLPDSRQNPGDARLRPDRYIDTALPKLLSEVRRLGGQQARLQVKIAGAGSAMDPKQFFRIGEQNAKAARAVLARLGLTIHASSVGGNMPQTMTLDIRDGRTQVRTPAGCRPL